MAKTIRYDDGVVIDHTARYGWISADDAESIAAKNRVTLPAGSVEMLEKLLHLAAARCVAAEICHAEIKFGADSLLLFTGRMMGAGKECGWLEVRLRVERQEYGEPMAAAHLRRRLEDMGGLDHPVAARVIGFLRAIESSPIIGAHDSMPECRRSLAERVRATDLEWWIEEQATPHGGRLRTPEDV